MLELGISVEMPHTVPHFRRSWPKRARSGLGEATISRMLRAGTVLNALHTMQ